MRAPPAFRLATRMLACTLATFTLALIGSAYAQSLPAPSRNVYKCEEAGKVFYSDAPCLGAKRVDVTPTRGLNKSVGREQVGVDVRREHQQEQMSDALRPLIGESRAEYAVRHKRAKLMPDQNRRCYVLDGEIAAAELAERAALASSPADLPGAQSKLLRLRQSFQSIGC